MVKENISMIAQIDQFKKLAKEIGLDEQPPESLDRIMSKLDLKRKPEPDGPTKK